MKTLKLIFSIIVLSTIIQSCTPQSLNDNQTGVLENTQATGDDGSSNNDGSKP